MKISKIIIFLCISLLSTLRAYSSETQNNYYQTTENDVTFLIAPENKNFNDLLDKMPAYLKNDQPLRKNPKSTNDDTEYFMSARSSEYDTFYMNFEGQEIRVYVDKFKVKPISHSEYNDCIQRNITPDQLKADKTNKTIADNQRKACQTYDQMTNGKRNIYLKSDEYLIAYFKCYRAKLKSDKTPEKTEYHDKYETTYRHYFKRAAAAFGAPFQVVACMGFKESSHWRSLTSKTHAKGIMQITSGKDGKHGTRSEIRDDLKNGKNDLAITGLKRYNEMIDKKNICDNKNSPNIDFTTFTKKELTANPEKTVIGGTYYLSKLVNYGRSSKLLNKIKFYPELPGISPKTQKWIIATSIYNRGSTGFIKLLRKGGLDYEKDEFSLTTVQQALNTCANNEPCSNPQKNITYCPCHQALAQLNSVLNCAKSNEVKAMKGDEIREDKSDNRGCYNELSKRFSELTTQRAH